MKTVKPKDLFASKAAFREGQLDATRQRHTLLA
jgi:hypothetical protein